MKKTIEKNKMQEVLDFANENRGFLFIVGNPLKDEIVVSFNGKATYVKFPTTENKKDNVLVQVLNKSSFKPSMNEILSAIVRATDLKPEDGNQLYQVVAGSLQAIVNSK
jgi:hypothetical protein